jgi:hypothetical protein
MQPVKPGDVVKLNEPDYMYGQGVLHLRVTEVGRVQQLPDGPWLDLVGVELRPDGSQFGSQPRHTLVRLSALRSQPRRAPGRQ